MLRFLRLLRTYKQIKSILKKIQGDKLKKRESNHLKTLSNRNVKK